ncbi:hypothetical protein KIPB_014504, partial [Kipferlia bialata]|eukprot:g14504.t1
MPVPDDWEYDAEDSHPMEGNARVRLTDRLAKLEDRHAQLIDLL